MFSTVFCFPNCFPAFWGLVSCRPCRQCGLPVDIPMNIDELFRLLRRKQKPQNIFHFSVQDYNDMFSLSVTCSLFLFPFSPQICHSHVYLSATNRFQCSRKRAPGSFSDMGGPKEIQIAFGPIIMHAPTLRVGRANNSAQLQSDLVSDPGQSLNKKNG